MADLEKNNAAEQGIEARDLPAPLDENPAEASAPSPAPLEDDSVDTLGPSEYEDVIRDGEYRLSRPYKFEDGEPQTVLKFPLKDMTGQHIRIAQRTYEMLEKRSISDMPELNKSYQAHVAAAVMGVMPDFVFDLPAKDFTRVTVFVQRFLLRSA